jgi:rRNA maturation RNase YbeY
MKTIITNEQNFVPVDEDKIRQAVRLVPWEGRRFKLSLVYVDDAEIAKLNERYLKHAGPTDVLSFPVGPNEGEIVVSGETALEEAKARGIEPEGELILYTIHGILHLLDYDDKTPKEAEKMHTVEKGVVTQMGYTWNWE